MASARSRLRILLTLTACLLIAAGLAWALVRRPAPVVDADSAPALAPSVAREAAPPAVSAPAQAAPAALPGIPVTRLPLRLLATAVREDPTLSLAIIVDLERAAHLLMSEGQSFEGRPSVRLASIERERVLIDHDGVREQLVVHGDAAVPETAGFEPTPEQREQRRDLSRRLRELTDAGKNYRDVLGRAERGGLLAEGDVSAAYEDGKMIGVQIDGIRADGVYDRIGLHNGDVVTDINGVSLTDPSAMAGVLVQVASSDVLTFSVERPDGSQGTLAFPTDQFRDLVGSLPLK